jgi:hypothetical protein
MLSARAFTFGFVLVLASCHRLTPSEQNLIGTWSYSGMDFTNRVEFRSDHRMATLFGDQEGRVWTPVSSGTWRIEGNDLVLEEHFLPNPLPLSGDTPRPKEAGRRAIREMTPEKIVWGDKDFAPYTRVK